MPRSSGIYLVMTNIPHRQWSYKIEERRKVIGRSPDADIPVPDHFDRVSRRHAEVWIDKYGPWIRDLESRYGTCVNGVWVETIPQAGIVMGDTLWVAGAEIQVVDRVDELARVGPRINDPDDTPPPGEPDPPGRAECGRLSKAEIEIMLWISRGYHTESDLAELLHRTAGTVHKELSSIFKKLDVHSVTAVMGRLKYGIKQKAAR